MSPEPLPPGAIVADRFVIQAVVAQGRFCITYSAVDQTVGRRVFLREIAPAGSLRDDEGLCLPGGFRVRQVVLAEWARLRRLRPTGVLVPEETLSANGTAYAILPSVEGAQAVEERLLRPVPAEVVAEWDLTLRAMLASQALISVSDIRVLPDDSLRITDHRIAEAWFTRVESEGGIEALFQVLGLEVPGRPRARPDGMDLDAIDRAMAESAAVRPAPHECPSCHGVLVRWPALRAGTCPVCRSGRLEPTLSAERKCPECRVGLLQRVHNRLFACPICPEGRLKRVGLLKRRWACRACGAAISRSGGGFQIGDEVLPWEVWLERARRAHTLMACDTCPAMWDVGKREWHRAGRSLYPEEWARLATGQAVSTGDLRCDACRCEWAADGADHTLLHAPRDPFGIAEQVLLQRLTPIVWEHLRSGERSAGDAESCELCGTQIQEGRLLRSTDPQLREHLDTTRSLADWHRIARGLPLPEDLSEWEVAREEAARLAYGSGRFDARPWWRGSGWVADANGITLGGAKALGVRLGGKVLAWDKVRSARALSKAQLEITPLQGEPWTLDVEPLELHVPMRSGTLQLVLNAFDLEARIASRMC